MCGRYQFTEPQNADLRRILQDVRRRCGDRAQDFRFGDVMPTAAAPVLIANGGKVVADLQTWGIPGWKGGLMINARAETVCEKPMFRRSMAAQRCVIPDMYPLYWTPSRGGIIMRYTYEYKRKCVELYREGKWPETPEGVSNKSFRDKVRLWVRAENSRGPEALKHKNFNRNWTPEERLELVSQVMSGKSCVSVAIEAGIQDRLLYQWVQNYKTKGYNGLVEMKKGRPSKGVPQMKKEEARPLNESEREELIRLRAENEYIKAENEVIKKEIALREERHAAQLKARKQRSSKSCVKKDTN